MSSLSFIPELILWVLPVLFAVTLHEVAHGWMANRLGDKTALYLGRLTLNPLKHIDLVGTLVVPAFCFFLGNFIFGWAKPVPVEWRNLKNPKRDFALVALAGPIANFLMAMVWAMVAKGGNLLAHQGYSVAQAFIEMGQTGIAVNLVLMVLNLIPIPPLDGSRIVSGVLPPRLSRWYGAIEPYGILLLLILVVTKVSSQIILPPVMKLHRFITYLFAL